MIKQIKSFVKSYISISAATNIPRGIEGYYEQRLDNKLSNDTKKLIINRYASIENTLLEVMQKIQNTSIGIPYQVKKQNKLTNDNITVKIEQLLSYPSPRQQTFEMLINDIMEEFLLNGVFYLMYEKENNSLKCIKTNEIFIKQVLATNNKIPSQYSYNVNKGSGEIFYYYDNGETIYFINDKENKFLFASEIEFESTEVNSSQHLSKSPLPRIANSVVSQKNIIEKNYFLISNKKEADLLLISGNNLIGEDKKRDLKEIIQNRIDDSSQTGKPCIVMLGGEEIKIDLKKINDNIFQQQFMDLYNYHAKHIYQYFGLPIEKGLEQAKYSNADNASIEYLEQAIKPKLNFIYSNLSYILSVIFDYSKQDYSISPNYNEHIIVKNYILQQLSQLADITTINERRQIIGYEPKEGGDNLIVKNQNLFDINENNI